MWYLYHGDQDIGEEGEKDPVTEKMDIYSIWSTINIIPATALCFGSTMRTSMNIFSAFPVLTDEWRQETVGKSLASSVAGWV